MNAPVSTAESASPVKRLCSALDAVKTAGNFAAFGRITPDNIKPISVHDVGSIAFPLQRATVQQLIEKARQAPYGRGSETFVDTAVRNTWELDAAQLNLSSQWGSTAQSACKWVAKELGIAVPVSAELYKMLIYEKGAMFKAHTDTEKIPGMFGTLVICLPSEHQGGDLVIKHRNVTKVFQTSISQPSMACWFSDVTHEVLPLISSVRCVLTYNLAIPVSHQDHVQRPSAALNTPGRASIQEALSAWLESRNGNDRRGDGADYLYYLLDHAYTEANLSLHGLKGADRDRMQCLKDVCDGLNVSLLFGLLEKEEFGYCDDVDEYPYRYRRRGRGGGGGGGDENWHPFIDTSHTTISIKKLVATDGSTLRRNMKVSKKDLQANLIHDQADPFRKAQRGERNYSGFTGNEGVSATHWYRVTVAVIIPKDDVDQFLIKGLNNNEAQTRLPQYLDKCSAPETRELGMKVVRQLARTAWSRDPLYGFYFGSSSSDPLNIEIALNFVATILKYREYDLFNKALGWFKTKAGAELFAHVKEAAAAPSFKFRKIKDSLLHNLSLRSVDQQMQLLTVLGLPTDASYIPKIGNGQLMKLFLSL